MKSLDEDINISIRTKSPGRIDERHKPHLIRNKAYEIKAGDSLFNIVRYFVVSKSTNDKREYICCKQPKDDGSTDMYHWVAVNNSFDQLPDLPLVVVSTESVIYMSLDGSCRCYTLLDFLLEYGLVSILRSKRIICDFGIIKSVLRIRAIALGGRDSNGLGRGDRGIKRAA
jgi:hypothetical protein